MMMQPNTRTLSEILQSKDSANNHDKWGDDPANGTCKDQRGSQPVNDKGNPNCHDRQSNQINNNKKTHLHISRMYSVFCALMCLLAGMWALLVFLSVYVLLYMAASWLFRPGHTLLKDHPALLDEFITSRVTMALVAMLLGVLSLGIARDMPELIPLSRMIHIAALFSAACCALMTASGDIVAASRPHNEGAQQS